MVRFHSMNDFWILIVLLADIHADLYMRAFDFGSQCLSDIVQQTSTTCQIGIQSQLRSQNTRQLCHFNGVRQDILPVAGTIIQPTQQLNHFIVDTMHIGFQNGTFALLPNAVFDFPLCLFHHFFNLSGMDSAVCNQLFQSNPCYLSAYVVKAGKGNGFRCIINDDIHSGQCFQCPDVSAFPSNDSALHFIVGQRYNGYCRFRNLIGCTLGNGQGDVVAGLFLTLILNLLLVARNLHDFLMHQFLIQCLEDVFLGLFPGKFRDSLQYIHLTLLDGFRFL